MEVTYFRIAVSCITMHTKIAGTPEHEKCKEKIRKRSQELRAKIKNKKNLTSQKNIKLNIY